MARIHAQLGPEFPAEHTFIQLQNKDGTCFINSVLQALFNLPPVQKFCEDCHAALAKHNLFETAENSPTLLIGHFVKIYIDSMRAPQNEVWYEPTYFLDRVFENEQFCRGEQSDANDFFLFLIRKLENDIELLTATTNECFPTFLPLFRFSLTNAFSTSHGMDQWFSEYLECNINKSTCPSIQECMNMWLSPESTTSTQTVHQLDHLGPILAVHVDIFVFNSEIRRVVKNFRGIEISDTLRLVDSSFEQTHKPKIYDLRAIIAHNGHSIDEGHYIAVFKTEGRWIVGDDTNIYGLSEDDIHGFLTHQALPGYDSIIPYMLFYQCEA